MHETRASLLLRLRDLRDEESWREFVDLYGPFIKRYLRAVGLSQEDASDLAQEILQIVVTHVTGFDYDPAKGSFRGWLRKVTRNRVWRFFRERQRVPAAPGGTTALEALNRLPDDGEMDEAWEREWRKRRLEAAMEKARLKVKPQTWEAFELAVLSGLPPETVAAKLRTSVGQVYVSKSRVIKRLREEVVRIDE